MDANKFKIGGLEWKSDFPEISESEIHLWRVSLNPGRSMLSQCEEALSTHEKGRMEFFNFAKVKQNYLVSQGILRTLLGRYLEIRPEEVQLGRHSKGKPFCIQRPELCFNISNSGSYCVYAFSLGSEIGIDLEEVRPLTDLEQMINKNFSFEEKLYIKQKKEDELRRFFLLWTIKESYLKAIGVGMRIEPQKLDFRVQNEEIKLISVNGMNDFDDWVFKEVKMEDDYVRTLTYQGKERKMCDFILI
ncbi:4'-phosphopantetheinyl transferase superfamily protein [bacterium AH-315-B15]|nr:4'-phosphopantetheinyl transferase superfamily protein [bacterium AH-315-B15]